MPNMNMAIPRNQEINFTDLIFLIDLNQCHSSVYIQFHTRYELGIIRCQE